METDFTVVISSVYTLVIGWGSALIGFGLVVAAVHKIKAMM